MIDFEVSNTLESSVFVETLKRAIQKGKPEIFNSDQGSQRREIEWIKVLVKNEIQISMDGRGRCFDNIFVERLWRTVKQEEVYLHEYQDVWQAEDRLRKYFEFYNHRRPHQSLGNKTPAEVYRPKDKTLQPTEAVEMPLLWKTQSSFPQVLGKAQSGLPTFPQPAAAGYNFKKKRRKNPFLTTNLPP